LRPTDGHDVVLEEELRMILEDYKVPIADEFFGRS
jgi:hypothetical protein